MKWLLGCLLALVMVSASFAGEDPFVAFVGNDILADINADGSAGFYLSPKYTQFLYDQTVIDVPVQGESFITLLTQDQPEVCDELGEVINFETGEFIMRGEKNAVVRKQNSGRFEWNIRLPKKPNAINICFQCGVLKPDTFTAFTGFGAVNTCAAYTGERIGTGWCTRDDVNPGTNPVRAASLPQITAVAIPGPHNFTFTPFFLTAYRNPGTYSFSGDMANNGVLQLLNGRAEIPLNITGTADVPGTRIMLKSCFDKCINVKLPVTGQVNAANQQETDLEYGDLLRIVMTIPRTNTVDIYCHPESAKLVGIGEAHW